MNLIPPKAKNIFLGKRGEPHVECNHESLFLFNIPTSTERAAPWQGVYQCQRCKKVLLGVARPS